MLTFQRPRRLAWSLPALTLLAVLSLLGCTSVPPASIPRLPDPPAPAECTRKAFEGFAPGLSGLPSSWATLSPDERARALLTNKADDAEQYQQLRARAIRCGR
jgi:hypothetical protein